MVVLSQHVYPSATFQAAYATNRPAIYTSVLVIAFGMTAVLLFVYDWLVTRRQDKTMASALRTDRLVASLFPEAVRDRLMNRNGDAVGSNGSMHPEDGLEAGTPIADFFPHTVSVLLVLSLCHPHASTCGTPCRAPRVGYGVI